MCWNWQVSLLTWIVGTGSGAYMIKRGNPDDLTLGLLIMCYSTMQLWEAFMWWNQSEKGRKVNILFTILAYFTLWSHTLAIGIGLYYEKRVVLPLIIGLMFMIVSLIESFTIDWKPSLPASEQSGAVCSSHNNIFNPCRHLVWGFPHRFYTYTFAVCIALCLVYIKPLSKGLIVSGLFVSSFIGSLLYAKGATGSYWCFSAAFFSFLFVYINRR